MIQGEKNKRQKKLGNFHYLPRGLRCLFDYDYDFCLFFFYYMFFFGDAFVVV